MQSRTARGPGLKEIVSVHSRKYDDHILTGVCGERLVDVDKDALQKRHEYLLIDSGLVPVRTGSCALYAPGKLTVGGLAAPALPTYLTVTDRSPRARPDERTLTWKQDM